jgi:hypothetical protein
MEAQNADLGKFELGRQMENLGSTWILVLHAKNIRLICNSPGSHEN